MRQRARSEGRNEIYFMHFPVHSSEQTEADFVKRPNPVTTAGTGMNSRKQLLLGREPAEPRAVAAAAAS
jgi:hypothetical protein